MDTKSLHFDKTIKNWDEALPLGNGDLGCLIWNKSNSLRFSIDKNGIWDCSNSPENQAEFNYKNLKKLVKEQNQKEIERIFDDCYMNTTPTKLPTGKIIINLGVRSNVISELNFITGEATIKAKKVCVRSFIHSNQDFGLIEINKENITYKIDNPKYANEKKSIFRHSSKGTTQSLKNLNYPKATFVNEKENNIEYQYFIQPTNDCFYGVVSGKINKDGKTLIAYTVCISDKNDFVQKGKVIIKDALLKGYSNSFNEHKKWWAQYWTKSSITLPDKELEKQWFLNTYLLACGSRKNHYPMPLQGVWTADNNSLPPWKGDYHHDLNTQMTYTSYLKSNHLEQGESFIDYLLNLKDIGCKFSEKFYGVKGLCLPSVMDIKGHALGGWSQYTLAPTNQLWLCQILTRYYLYTKDKAYLEKIYEYNNLVGEFLLNILEEKNDKYKLPLSSSPEINDNKLSAWLTPNTNYDLALMQNFMDEMIILSNEIGDEENAKFWKEQCSKLEPLAINDNKILMLSSDKNLEESHRHHAHCMSIYPLKSLEYTTKQNKEIIASTVKNLEDLGRKEWVGYSVGWLAELYIAMGNGDAASEELHKFFKYNCTQNGFHVNGDYLKKLDFKYKYRLFTLEGNFIACDAIQDMLFYSEKGKIQLFPAIPKSWKNAEFNNFRGYDGIIVSAKLENGIISHLEITATTDCKISIENDLSHLKSNATNIGTVMFELKAYDKITFYKES